MSWRCRGALLIVSALVSASGLVMGPLVGCIDVSGLEGPSDGGGGADHAIVGSETSVDGGPLEAGELPPVPSKAVRCGATTCQGDAGVCCLEATPRCIGNGDPTCTALLLFCDDRDDCPVGTDPRIMPVAPIVCCLQPLMSRSACIRGDRCTGTDDQPLCDPARGNQCAAAGFGTCIGNAAVTPYKRCQ